MFFSRLWTALLKAAPLRLWALLSAGPALTAGAIGLVGIIWKGEWPLALAAKRLDFLGWSLLIVLFLIAVIVVALAAVRVKGAGPGGTRFEIDASDENDQDGGRR